MENAMDNSREMLDEQEIDELDTVEKSTGRVLFVIFMLMLIIPILIIAVLYNVNANFRNTVNMIKSPVISKLNDRKLTPEERKKRVDYLAKRYTESSEQTAVDKLYTIKKEDGSLYQDILSAMNAKNPKKTKAIVEKIRSKELNKDFLVRNYEEAMGVAGEELVTQAKALEKSDLLPAKEEIRRKIHDSDVGKLISLLSSKKLAEILYYMTEPESADLLRKLDDQKALEVRAEMETLKYNRENLKSTAGILEKKPISDAVSYINSHPELTAEQLAVILENLSLPKAASVAARVSDRNRVDDAFYQLSLLERLLEKDEGRASDISDLVDYISEYEKKINELVSYYKKVEANVAAPIFEKLLNNNKDVSVLTVSDPSGLGEKLFKTTDRKVALDVASRMKPKNVSEIISVMDSNIAALFTELLAHPDRAIVHENSEGDKDNSRIKLDVSFNDGNISALSQEFSKRAKDLASAFDKMTPKELSKLVRLMLSGTPSNKRTIANILSKVKADTMAKLLEALPQGDRTTLSNLMVTDNTEQSFATDSFETADKMSEELAAVYNKMGATPLATLIKRTVDDAYDYEETGNLETLVRVLEKMSPEVLSPALDLLNPDMSGEITDLIYKYKQKREVRERNLKKRHNLFLWKDR